jgi:YHS domain-containing protein
MSTRSIPRFAFIVLLSLVAAPLPCPEAAQTGQDPAAKPAPVQAGQPVPTQGEWKGDPYSLPTDPVSGEALGAIEKQVVIQHEGRELRFATKESAEKFKADPKKYLAAVDQKLVLDQKPFYPLETCLVSGEKLDSGAPDLVYKNRLVRLSTRDHEAAFVKDSAKFIEKLDAAVIAKQGPTYVAKTCAVSNEGLGEMGAPVDYVVGNRLIRMCCKGCKKDVDKDPMKYLLFPDRKNETEAQPKEPKKE